MQVIVVLLLTAALLTLVAIWAGFSASLLLTSRYELKKRAQGTDKQAKVVYGLTAGGREIYIAMLLGGVFAVACITLLLQTIMWGIFAAVLATLLVVLGGILGPFVYGQRLGLNITTRLAPLAEKAVTLLRYVAKPITQRIDIVLGKKSILYSKDQLVSIIEGTAKSPFADISEDEARLVRNSLSFGTVKIADVMVPRKVVDMVNVHDQVGPLVMDELHKSGHSRFPVYDPKNNDEIVGILYLRTLIGEKRSGPVKKLMSPKVFFVHEELDLNHALDAFIKTKHHLFVVVNNFEEFVGIVTIEDILERILGRQIVDEFDAYENLREVAALRAKRERAHKTSVKSEATVIE